MQRLAHKYRNHKDSILLLSFCAIWSLFILSACSPDKDNHQEVDRLNDISYARRYQNLDSAKVYAMSALAKAAKCEYDEGRAEATLNLAFCDLAWLNYSHADSLFSIAESLTADNLTRLIVEIQRMRLCQRRSMNKEFYFHKTAADNLISIVRDDIPSFSQRQKRKYTYAMSEYGIVLSTYLYYVNLTDESSQALLSITSDMDINLLNDTAQYLGYLYNIGSGGILREGNPDDIFLREFDCLMQCYILAQHANFQFWEANSLQSLSEHLSDARGLSLIQEHDPACLRYLNDDNVPDSLLSGNLAERSLQLFQGYGDIYQTAGAWRTLSQCYHRIGDYEAELSCLLYAVEDTLIMQAPDLLASIYEKMSIAYSALNDKPASDYYRNNYLDIQNYTRQDRQLEARAEALANNVKKTQWLLSLVVVVLMILIVVCCFLIYYRKHRDYSAQIATIRNRIEEWKKQKNHRIESIREETEQSMEEKHMLLFQQDNALRTNVEQRAKVAYTQNILPLIDRMLHSVSTAGADSQTARMQYVSDICEAILEYNNNLTSWVQLRKGQVALHIEKFPLSDLLNIIRLNEKSFSSAGIRLNIEETDISVRADKILTLFIINTIADNARKFTPSGGVVTISAIPSQEIEGYAQISIADSGEGMEKEKCENLFSYKPIMEERENLVEQKSHGFGLLNCRGIIDRYKKTSSIFSHCFIKAESEKGRGTRISFTLPMIMKALIPFFLILLPSLGPYSAAASSYDERYETTVNAYADSVYDCNVRGDYSDAIAYADSCLWVINARYVRLYPDNQHDTLTILSNGAELGWQERGVKADYDIIIFLRNEIAVASLALHEWVLYEGNNNAYTKLYKLCSKDTTLNTYCITMEKTEQTSNIYIVIICVSFCLLALAFWYFYLKDVVKHRKSHADLSNLIRLTDTEKGENTLLERLSDAQIGSYSPELQPVAKEIKATVMDVQNVLRQTIGEKEMVEDEISRIRHESERLYISNSIIDNTLSALKHETMYYPSRINVLVKEYLSLLPADVSSGSQENGGFREDKIKEILDITAYYRNLYAMLSKQVNNTETDCIMINKMNVSELKLDFETKGVVIPEQSQIILANRSLMNFLCFILKKRNNQVIPIVDALSVNGNYLTFHLLCEYIKLTESEISQLFSLSSKDFDFLIIRQILRDIGNASNHFAAGIIVRNSGQFLITVPLLGL